MNIEHPTSNIEWEKMKKQTYDLEERLLKGKMNIEHPIGFLFDFKIN
jgi:hypothetical protein